MSSQLRVACIQTEVGDDVQANVRDTLTLAHAAAKQGADLLLTPEHFTFIGSGQAMRSSAEIEESHLALTAFREFAADARTWILLGSLTISTGEGRLANRSFLIDSAGSLIASYDKVHMFDANLPSGWTVHESRLYRAGNKAVLADTPWGLLGMSVCYDLRFPHLYRALAQAGATFLSVPAAFAESTGEAHWHVLLRARAIETGCFVLAPAMCGTHSGNLATYGHSLIVDPWGEILADGGSVPGIVSVDLDPRKVTESREMVPSLRHDQVFGPSVTIAHEHVRKTESGK